MNYEQLKQDLFWQIQPLMLNYGIDEDCIYLKQLIDKMFEEGYDEGFILGRDASYE